MAECSISAHRLPSGEYESSWFPMRVNCDHCPYMEAPQTFPAPVEALDEARRQANEWLKCEQR